MSNTAYKQTSDCRLPRAPRTVVWVTVGLSFEGTSDCRLSHLDLAFDSGTQIVHGVPNTAYKQTSQTVVWVISDCRLSHLRTVVWETSGVPRTVVWVTSDLAFDSPQIAVWFISYHTIPSRCGSSDCLIDLSDGIKAPCCIGHDLHNSLLRYWVLLLCHLLNTCSSNTFFNLSAAHPA